jgi:hypothetical protein
VQLEVEEYLVSAAPKFGDERVAGGIVEFHPHLEPEARIPKPIDKCESTTVIRDVQRYRELLSWVEQGSLILRIHNPSLQAAYYSP